MPQTLDTPQNSTAPNSAMPNSATPQETTYQDATYQDAAPLKSTYVVTHIINHDTTGSDRANLPVIAMVMRANRGIGTGHLMRVRSLLAPLKEHAYLRLYGYAFEPDILPLCNDYDEVRLFNTKEEVLSHLLHLPDAPSYSASTPKPEPLSHSGSTPDTLNHSGSTPNTLNHSNAAPALHGHDTRGHDTCGHDSCSHYKHGYDTCGYDTHGHETRGQKTLHATGGGDKDAVQTTVYGEVKHPTAVQVAHKTKNTTTQDHVVVTTECLPQLFIIDDYALDASFEAPLYERAQVMVIDDLYDRKHQCHVLLDQSLLTHESVYRKLCPPDCQLLLGSRYSLTQERFYPQNYDLNYHSPCTCGAHHSSLSARALRGKTPEQIAAARHNPNSALHSCMQTDGQSAPLPHVLINFGGADPVSACKAITHTIIQGKLYEDYRFTLLTGAANSDYDDLAALVTTIPQPYQAAFQLIHHCHDVADLLFKHDVAIGAYGGMFRERIAAGIPTIGVLIADNQKGADVVVEQENLGLTLALSQLSDINAVKNALNKLVAQASTYTNNCFKVYDGQGLKRIVKAIVALLPPHSH